jgi:16S rRNA (guanine1207-N2)-methyltransferase
VYTFATQTQPHCIKSLKESSQVAFTDARYNSLDLPHTCYTFLIVKNSEEATVSHYFHHRSGELSSGEGQQTQVITAHVAGHTLQLSTGAGVFSRSGLDSGSALLLETFLAHSSRAQTSPRSHPRYLDLGCGWGAVGCFLATARPDCRVALCDINLRAAELATENLRSLGLTNGIVWCGDGANAARSGCFDAVLCNPPVRAGNAVIARLFDDARQALVSGGELWFVLRTAQGAKSWARRVKEQFGACDTLAMQKGYRILKAVKS